MLLKNGLVFREKTGTRDRLDIKINNEKIKEISPEIDKEPGEAVYDVEGKYILPGIIDSHTHFQLEARGAVARDDFYRGSKAAACGGVTTYIDYADQSEQSILSGLRHRQEQARGKTAIDYHLHQVISREFKVDRHLKELYKLPLAGISSLKLFTTYRDIYMLEPSVMKTIFKAAADIGLVVTVHSEKNRIIENNQKKFSEKGKTDYKYHPWLRPGQAEAEAVEELADYAEETGARLYIVHLSSGPGYKAVKRASARDLQINVETTPHYLLLTKKLLRGEEARYNFMTPPLRTSYDNEKLWEGIRKNYIDTVATDHCAFTPSQKQQGQDALDTLPGIAGVETLFPLLYTYGVDKGRIEMERLMELVSINPAKIFGLYPKKGSLKPGTDADILVYDPESKHTLTAENLHSAAAHTPYQGMEVKGRVQMTIVRGKIVVKAGEFVGKKGYGKFVRAKFD